MGKKILTLANILFIQYFVTTHYELPNKWIWLLLSAVVCGVVLGLWMTHSETKSDQRDR